MVAKRKVAKKKTAKTSASPETTAAAPKSVKKSVPKKKGVAVKRKPKSSSGDLVLNGAIVISNVLEWKEKITAAISNQDELIIDGGEIEQIDGAGLQLLVSVMKEVSASRVSIKWKSASDLLRNNASQLGLVEILSLDGLPESE